MIGPTAVDHRGFNEVDGRSLVERAAATFVPDLRRHRASRTMKSGLEFFATLGSSKTKRAQPFERTAESYAVCCGLIRAASRISRLGPPALENNNANGDVTNNGVAEGNTAVGSQALLFNTDGALNTAVGVAALVSNVGGNENTAIGTAALEFNDTGEQNTAVGAFALFNNTIGNFNTANGFNALTSNTNGTANTAIGMQALLNNTEGSNNTAIGINALFTNTVGVQNTATGFQTLFNNTGSDNTADGFDTLTANTTGHNSTATGFQALFNNTEGSFNTAIGNGAGIAVVTANHVIAIGHNGQNVSNTTWINNVYGVTTQSGTTAPVIVSDDGQLGTVASSERFKKDIATMKEASDAILSLRPVTFHYKTDTKETPQFGLIAEEVAKVNPALVLPDKQGKPYTVRYDAVNAMLLNEFLKEHSKVEKLEATVGKQHKDFEAALADLKGQIQKVSAQLELSKPPPQTVLNNR